MSQDTAPTTQVHVEEDGHKVFVGNLSFQTTEDELSELFSKPTPVLRANIITRGTRSLGYGFVAYETLAQAEQAAKTHDKTELGGRQINVEVAKPKVERAPAAPKEKTPKKSKAEKAAENKDAAAAEAGEGEGEIKPRTGRAARSRANRKASRNKTRNEGEEGTSEEAAAPADANGEAKEKRTRTRNNRKSRKGAANGDAGAEVAASTPRTVGPPSKTTVFVANLPFAMEDDGLKALFAEFKVAAAHVVRRHGTGRSKGFGFVELVDEAEQQNVLEKMKDAQADGRDLVIKVALSEEHAAATEEAKAAETQA
ncbi:hypothetical protein BGZ83_003830 [Gryganskiella cystojenkinii]|nr:hypothetical protein BGZ83_003830 [Gryganskiella cystojenkinii]